MANRRMTRTGCKIGIGRTARKSGPDNSNESDALTLLHRFFRFIIERQARRVRRALEDAPHT